MKRLLAYLFIVLGFSVISNVKTEAAVIQVCDKWGSTLPTNFFKSERKWKKHKNSSGKCKSYFKKDSKLIYNDLKNILKRYPYSDKTYTNIINKSDYSGFVNKHNVSWGNTGKDEILFAGNVMSIKAYCQLVDNHIGSLKNSIKYEKNCKKKSSQTQKVASEITYDWVAITKHPKRNKNFIATKLSTKKKAIDLAMMKCYKYVTNSLSKRSYNDCSLVNVYNEKNKDVTQLVKKELSQSLDFENYKNFRKWSILHKYDGRYFWNDSVNLNLQEAIAESAVDCVSQIKRYSNLRVFPKDCKLNTIQIVSINNKK